MSTLFSLIRTLLLIALLTTGMVMLANSANAAVMSATQFYAQSAEPLLEEARRLEEQTTKALQLHQQLLKNEVSTREAFHHHLYKLTTAEQTTDEVLNPARFRIGIPSKHGIKPEQYNAMQISLTKDNPLSTRSADIRDLVREESRRYEEVLQDNETAFTEVQESLAYLSELHQQLVASRTGDEAKRKYELFLRRLSTAKQQYYRALDEFCIAAAQAEYKGLTGKRLVPGDSPFQLYQSKLD